MGEFSGSVAKGKDRCYCNNSSMPHRHTKDGVVDAPDGPNEASASATKAGVGVKKPIS